MTDDPRFAELQATIAGRASATSVPERQAVATAMVSLGVRLAQDGQHQDALNAYDLTVEFVGEDDDPKLQEAVALALRNKAHRLGVIGREQDAAGVIDELVRRFGRSQDPAIRGVVARGMFTKAHALRRLEHDDAATTTLDELIARFSADVQPEGLRVSVADAMVMRANIMVRRDMTAACQLYDEIAESFGPDAAASLRERGALALLSKGSVLGEQRRFDRAVATQEYLIDRYGADTDPRVRSTVLRAWAHIAQGFELLGKRPEALSAYRVVRRLSRDSELDDRDAIRAWAQDRIRAISYT